MKNIDSFKSFSDERSQNYLSQSFPKGKMFSNLYDIARNIYNFVLCLSQFIKVVTGQLFTLAKNRDIDQTEELLTEWEMSVKLSERFPTLETLALRRIAVKRLISKIPVYNLRPYDDDDFTIEKYIKDVTNIDVEIENLAGQTTTSDFPILFPIVFGLSYAARLMLLNVKVDTGAIPENNEFPIPFPVGFFIPTVPETTQELLSKALGDVVPTYHNWQFEVLF